MGFVQDRTAWALPGAAVKPPPARHALLILPLGDGGEAGVVPRQGRLLEPGRRRQPLGLEGRGGGSRNVRAGAGYVVGVDGPHPEVVGGARVEAGQGVGCGGRAAVRYVRPVAPGRVVLLLTVLPLVDVGVSRFPSRRGRRWSPWRWRSDPWVGEGTGMGVAETSPDLAARADGVYGSNLELVLRVVGEAGYGVGEGGRAAVRYIRPTSLRHADTGTW